MLGGLGVGKGVDKWIHLDEEVLAISWGESKFQFSEVILNFVSAHSSWPHTWVILAVASYCRDGDDM